MKLVALTGGIGSGKTTVAKIFESIGIPVFYADSEARHLMEYNPKLKSILINKFGHRCYAEEGKLNAKFISDIVFNDPAELKWLNKTVHPFVGDHLKIWLQENGSAYGIMETALIKESMHIIDFYKIIVVTSPQNLRIKRIEKRDRTPHEIILKKISHQIHEDELSKLGNYTIYNDGSQSLVKQIWKIHQSICLGLSE